MLLSTKSSHFSIQVIVVSDHFSGKSLIDRHRLVNSLLEEELQGPIHALSIQAKTSEQWEKSGHKTFTTPPCLGGSKK